MKNVNFNLYLNPQTIEEVIDKRITDYKESLENKHLYELRKIISSLGYFIKKVDLNSKKLKKDYSISIYGWISAEKSRASKLLKKSLKVIDGLINKKDYVELYKLRSKLVDSCIFISSFIKKIELGHLYNVKDFSISNLSFDDLKKGDIILSVKSKKYLKRDLLSRFIAFAQMSNITHSLVVYSVDKGVKVIESKVYKGDRGLKIYDIKPRDGEVYMVMRPNLRDRMDEYLRIIDKWALDIKNNNFGFSEIKSWIAVLNGILFSRSVTFLRRNVTFPNPFSYRRHTFYCSEIVDCIFRDLGLKVVPRSSHECVVGPSEFLFSPYLDFVGLIDPKNSSSERFNSEGKIKQ